jgi:hypothetical protein
MQLTAKAFGKGFDIVVGVSLFILAQLAAVASTDDACKDDPLKHALGLSASATVGIEAVASIEANGQTLVLATIVV